MQRSGRLIGVSIRESKLGLNTSRPILPIRGLAEAGLAGLCVETCILPRSIERVEELHSEERAQSIRMHGNLFGQAQVFIVAGEFADRKRSRCVAKGKVRCGNER
jgi:hypothetical protein